MNLVVWLISFERCIRACISWRKLCPDTFKASSEEVIMMHSEKTKKNTWRRMCEGVFFHKLAGWHLATPLLVNLFTNSFQGFGYFSFLYKMLEKHLWNSFLQYLMVEILQLLHEISSFPRGAIKEVFWKTQNSQINTRSSHPEVFYQKKRCSWNFAKFTEKHLYRSLFLNKVAGNLKLSEAGTGDVL